MSNEEHRQQWPSRLSFILAAMGSSIGLGNLLRYPSVAWANWGSQWFIPYVLALFFIGIPLLLLEIAMGQSYRSSNLVALGRISPRFRGLGLATIVNAYVVATYYNVIIAWAMVYLGRSFESPLPWAENAGKFFEEEVIRNVGETIADSNGAIIWATWAAGVGVWACVFLFLFKGVDVLGKIVYVTMGVPVFMLFVLVARGVTLDNASDGIHLYIGVWRGAELWKPVIWQDAVGQIFFSIGAGFGVFTAYASYNPKGQHAVVDSLIVGISNSVFEMIAGFAGFGVAGFLKLVPGTDKLGTFKLGFITWPAAIAELPGANAWSVIFFLTLFLLGIDSAFSLVEGLVTLAEDSQVIKASRNTIVFTICAFGCLCSLIYSSDVGLTFLDKVDKYTNSFALPFVAFAECFGIGYVYRWNDVYRQVGPLSHWISIVGYIGSVTIAFFVSYALDQDVLAAIIGFVVFIGSIFLATVVARTPDVNPYGSSTFMNKFYWVAMYQVDQMRKDLNVSVAEDGKMEIPFFWGFIMKYITGPVCLILASFSLKDIETVNEFIVIFGFALGLAVVVFTLLGVASPSVFEIFLPRGEKEFCHSVQSVPGELLPLKDDDDEEKK